MFRDHSASWELGKRAANVQAVHLPALHGMNTLVNDRDSNDPEPGTWSWKDGINTTYYPPTRMSDQPQVHPPGP